MRFINASTRLYRGCLELQYPTFRDLPSLFVMILKASKFNDVLLGKKAAGNQNSGLCAPNPASDSRA